MDRVKESSLQAFVLATRPKTLLISLPPVLVATCLALSQGYLVDWLIPFSALVTSLLIQIGTNLVNDAIDYKKGADGKSRIGPLRMTESGRLTYSEVFRIGLLCFFLSFVAALPLLFKGGVPIALVLGLSILSGYLYTGGPYPLAYIGMGDVFVFLFFGLVATGAIYYLETFQISMAALLASCQIGLLAVVPLTINNLRDAKTDRLAQKNTLAVRFGKTFSLWLIALCSFVPYLIGLFWFVEGYFFSALLPFLSFPFVFKNVRAIWKTDPGIAYNQFLAESARCQFFYSLLLALSFFIRL